MKQAFTARSSPRVLGARLPDPTTIRRLTLFTAILFLVAGTGFSQDPNPGPRKWPSNAQEENKQAAPPDSLPSPVRLENGITVLMHSVPGLEEVAVEAFYPVGFVNEPKGMTQAAHLLEHLVCNAATRSYQPGASMALLNAKGMANAETLPGWTHYDYGVLAGDLDLALRIEAERLTSLRITREMILQESPRCYQEADFVERNPQAGMLKHAFMALSQAWRHQEGRALIRGGMEQFEIDALERFHSAYYRPENLTLILIGGFEREKTLDLVRKHLGGLKLPAAEKPTPIDWSKVPRAATVRWDSKVTAVCLAFPPPADRLDQIVLSLWGSVLAERLRTDAEILAAAEMVDCTNHLWAVGELPFYIYATVNGGSSPEAVEKILRNRAEALAGERPSETVLTQMRMRATQLSAPTQRLTTEQVLADAAKLRGDRLDHLGAAGGEQTLREVGWGELQKAGRLGAGQIVQGDGPDGTTALKIEHASDDAASITVLTIEDPGITTSRYAIVGQVRCADVMKPGHLELLNYFPDGGPYFSRTLMDAGPMQKLQGTSVWRAFELPFTLTDSPLRPTKLELNVVLPGRGTVCLSPLRLVQYGTPQPTRRPARAADASAQPVQDRATAMVVGQAAINWGVAHRLFGPDPSESLRKLEALTAADLHGIIERYLSTDRAFATTLLPAGSGK